MINNNLFQKEDFIVKKSTLVAASLCALLAVISIGGCGSNSSSSNPNSTQQTSSSASSSNYKLVLSDKRPTKMAYIAIVPDSPVTKDQLEKISQEVFEKAKKENPKATNLFVSFTDTDIEGIPYTYGQIQSINGKVSETLHIDKDWTKKPSERDYKTYILYNKFIQQNPKASYEDFVNSYQDAPSADEIKSSVEKVQAWIMK